MTPTPQDLLVLAVWWTFLYLAGRVVVHVVAGTALLGRDALARQSQARSQPLAFPLVDAACGKRLAQDASAQTEPPMSTSADRRRRALQLSQKTLPPPTTVAMSPPSTTLTRTLRQRLPR